MRKTYSGLLILCMVLLLVGCETFKGAKDGFRKDWENLEKQDSWMRENLW